VSGVSIERLLDNIESDISNYLIFVGVLDNNAKLLSFRRGKASFSLPIERHDTLDVQLSLMFSLIRQLEDISGNHKLTVTRFAKHDVFLFETEGLHVFVITSPTPEGQVAKKLSDVVGSIADVERPLTTSTMNGRGNEQTIAPTMTSVHREQSTAEVQKFQHSRSKPEAIAMLQGYLMALEAEFGIQEDAGGFYKIKANTKDGKLPWSVLEKINFAFKNRIEFQNIGTDADAKVYLMISVK
jgi:hypothetical protein